MLSWHFTTSRLNTEACLGRMVKYRSSWSPVNLKTVWTAQVMVQRMLFLKDYRKERTRSERSRLGDVCSESCFRPEWGQYVKQVEVKDRCFCPCHFELWENNFQTFSVWGKKLTWNKSVCAVCLGREGAFDLAFQVSLTAVCQSGYLFPSVLRRIPWRRAWQSTPVFLPGESPWAEEAGGLQSVHRVAQNWTWLKRLRMHACMHVLSRDGMGSVRLAVSGTKWLWRWKQG